MYDNKPAQVMALVLASQRHWRYSRGCKRAEWHRHGKKECQERAKQLYDEVRREQRTAKTGWLPYKD